MKADRSLSDDQTTVRDLRDRVRRFVAERDWEKFHAPKNLAMALAIEAAELMEHFQWIDGERSRSVMEDPARAEKIADELADVFCYALALANELDVDLSAAFERKMAKNARKYPADEIRGRYGHDDPGK